MKKKAKGSFTIEAALIMPIILFVILAITYLSFYLHDICRINALVDNALYRAQFLIKHEVDFMTSEINYHDINDRGVFYSIFGNAEKEEEDIKEYVAVLLERGLLLAHITDINVSVKGSDINISVQIKIKLPFKGAFNYIGSNEALTVEAFGKIHNSTESVRISEVVLDTGSKIKGMDKLKKKFEKFIK